MPVARFLASPALAASALLALASFASAQVATGYAFTQNVGSYTPITGGAVLGTGSPANTLDDATFAVTLPFSFNFDNVAQTQIHVSTNGFISFGATAPGTSNYVPLSNSTAYAGAVSAFGRDLQAGFSFLGSRTLGSDMITGVTSFGPIQVGDQLVGTGIPTGATVVAILGTDIQMSAVATATNTTAAVTAYGPWSELSYDTVGSAPNREFVVQWSGFKRFGTTLTTVRDMRLNFQIRLAEATGDIAVVYGDCTPGASTLTTVNQVGLRGPTNAFATDVNNRLNTKGVNDDWVNSVQGTVNTSGMVFNNVSPANVIANGLTYTWTQAQIATNISYGAGCGATGASFYEHFTTTPSIDLSNTAFRMFNTGSGYVVMPSTAAFVTPSGTATNLNLGDDSNTQVALSAPFTFPGGSTSSFDVCSNGFVSAAVGNGTSFQPTPGAMLTRPQASWNVWRDFICNATGNVWFEEVGTVAYITWLDVIGYVGTSPGTVTSTFQLQFDLANGHVDFVFGAMDTVSINGFTGGEGWVVGYSPAGSSFNPGSIDLTTAVPATIVLPGADVLPLTQTASPTPVLGNTVVYTTDNVPAGALYTVGVFSFGQINPGVAIPGAADCLQFVDLSAAVLVGMIGGPSVSNSLAIPTSTLFIGATLYVQSASLVPGANALGVITSNGMASTISNL